MKAAIVGAGAAGCFCAIELARQMPEASITVFEAGAKPLAKVSVTGGGRCNLTNTFEGVKSLSRIYPRGEHLMRRALSGFGPEDTIRWWEREGVQLVTEENGCIFPKSQDAMQIVRTLLHLTERCGVRILCSTPAPKIATLLREYDAVAVCAGGKNSKVLEDMLEGTGVEVTDTVPSLFTLKVDNPGLKALMGTVVRDVTLSLGGFRSEGTLLVTDWGVSGPATLKLSSYAARALAASDYRGTLQIGWMPGGWSAGAVRQYGPKMLAGVHPPQLSGRLWEHILDRAGLRPDIRCAELGTKGAARLESVLACDSYPVVGRAKFKEEFVTCGGVALAGIRPETMESRVCPGLYFAGEVLDIDAVTGGFNLQAAWSTGYRAAHGIAARLSGKEPQTIRREG